MNGEPSGLPIGIAGKFRIFLIAFASLFVFGLLFYTQQITDQLLQRERDVVGLYARSLEYVAANPSTGGDVTFAFEVIRAIDFPIILTDTANTPQYWKNIDVDTATLAPGPERKFFKDLIESMDRQNTPIRIAVNDTLVLNYIHYGESALIRKLRWLPAGEISIAAIFLFIAAIAMWIHSAATAKYLRLLWEHYCEEDGLDPKTGKCRASESAARHLVEKEKGDE